MPYSDKKKQREYQRKWAKRRRSKYVTQCIDCGSNDELEVHHKDPEQKVSHRIWSWKEDRILEELSKCDILCRECHDKQHGLITNPGCGTLSKYSYGCRCDLCKKIKSEDDRKRYLFRVGRIGNPLGLDPRDSTFEP